MNLKGKTVVISGGAGGIGSACVQAFLKEGAHVAVLDLQGERLKEIGKLDNVNAYPIDLCDIDSFDALLDQIIADMGKLDILIQAAGYMQAKDSFAMEEESWERVFSVNVKGMFFLAQKVMEKSMKKYGGSMVNFSSAAAIRGFYGNMASPHYASSKAAVIAMSRQLAVEWGKYQVRVNAVVPGGVMSDAMKALHFDNEQMSDIPLGRLSTPQEIANVVLFLSSDMASMISGQAIVIDGGASIVGQ